MDTPPLYEFGGAGPVMHLAVANGFPPQTYQPLLQPLTAQYRVVSLPPRALWPHIDPPPEAVGSWQDLADDILHGLRQYSLNHVIAVGHSFGGVATIRAALTEPERFRALILLDPTLLPVYITNAIRQARAEGQTPRIPLVDSALNRRSQFANVDEAYAYWRGKPLFHDWSDAAVRLYAESLTRPAANGGGLELAWPREWEAYYYLSIDADIWDDLPRLRGLLPTLILQGANTDAYVPDSAKQVQQMLPEATHITLPGYGHLFPLAAPEATRKIIEGWLREQALIG
ncbi:MAG: alpha/beta hydrolase [Anaerolineae bacterium]|nr:alpha/beta hydrolase [Anaerolineae bacterium]